MSLLVSELKTLPHREQVGLSRCPDVTLHSRCLFVQVCLLSIRPLEHIQRKRFLQQISCSCGIQSGIQSKADDLKPWNMWMNKAKTGQSVVALRETLRLELRVFAWRRVDPAAFQVCECTERWGLAQCTCLCEAMASNPTTNGLTKTTKSNPGEPLSIFLKQTEV